MKKNWLVTLEGLDIINFVCKEEDLPNKILHELVYELEEFIEVTSIIKEKGDKYSEQDISQINNWLDMFYRKAIREGKEKEEEDSDNLNTFINNQI